MLGHLHFVIPYNQDRDVIVALNQDTSTIWFELLSVFPDVTKISYKNGNFIRVVPEDSEDMVPAVYVDGVAALESAISIEDQELYQWLYDVISYYECPDMDWSIFQAPMEA